MIKSRLNANFLTEQIIQGKYHLSRIEPGDDIKVINRLNLNFTIKTFSTCAEIHTKIYFMTDYPVAR